MNKTPIYAVIRIRGQVNTPYEVEHILKLLRLHKKHHCAIYPASLPGLEEMLLKVKDYITWGEIERNTLVQLLRIRGKIPGGKNLSDEYVNEKLGLKNGIEELADAILEGRIQLHKIDSILKPVFRLHPPRRGFKGTIKKTYKEHGETGYRGQAINELIQRML